MAALITLAIVPSTASAAPDQNSLDEVVKALKVSRQPSDYVIVVDTSGSMLQDNRYAKVKTAIRSLLKTLKDDDRVSLVTFDKLAELRFRGAIGRDRLAALRSLPTSPQGQLTDIGAGLAAGIGELESAKAKEVGAIVLITDGQLDTAPDSVYRTVDSPGWAQLRSRADKVSERHRIASYAIALESSADAALLKKAFPKAEDIPADAIDERLAKLDAALLRFQAAQILEADVAHEVQVSWGADLTQFPEKGGMAAVNVTLRSTYNEIPVDISGLAVTTTSGPSVSVEKVPASIRLGPGKSVTIPVRLTFSGSGSGQLRLTGNVASPWQRVITKTLGLTFTPVLEADAPVATSSASQPLTSVPATLPWPAIGIGGAVAAAIALLAVWSATRPRLVGSLALSRSGVVLDEFILAGRSQALAYRESPGRAGLKGTAHAVARRSDQPGQKVSGVKVSAKVDMDKVKAELFDGESVAVGDLTITYTSPRTRMIELISDHSG